MEGLISYDNNDQLIPGVAARWEIRDDGATFWIREGTMGDGEPVTAHDFEFAWKRVWIRRPLSMPLFYTRLKMQKL